MEVSTSVKPTCHAFMCSTQCTKRAIMDERGFNNLVLYLCMVLFFSLSVPFLLKNLRILSYGQSTRDFDALVGRQLVGMGGGTVPNYSGTVNTG